MSFLKIKNISFQYGELSVLDQLSLSIEHGTIACLLGPSGCGKSTLLRIIAGLEPIHKGSIAIDGTEVSLPKKVIPPFKRGVGIVFQDNALFGNMTVEKNILFGLEHLDYGKKQLQLESMLVAFGIEELRHRYPHQISQGQQQRVAIARSLAPQPRLLLMDEPFANLDQELKVALMEDLRHILKERSITALIVTHDQIDAFTLADKVGILYNKTLQQWDTPFNIYHQPKNKFIASFVGEGTFVQANAITSHSLLIENQTVQFPDNHNCPNNQLVQLLLRPDDVIYDTSSTFKVLITKKAFRGDYYLLELKTETGNTLLSIVDSHLLVEVGSKIGVRFNIHNVVLIS
jgi:iron(III) transport system ATP-binding protein